MTEFSSSSNNITLLFSRGHGPDKWEMKGLQLPTNVFHYYLSSLKMTFGVKWLTDTPPLNPFVTLLNIWISVFISTLEVYFFCEINTGAYAPNLALNCLLFHRLVKTKSIFSTCSINSVISYKITTDCSEQMLHFYWNDEGITNCLTRSRGVGSIFRLRGHQKCKLQIESRSRNLITKWKYKLEDILQLTPPPHC